MDHKPTARGPRWELWRQDDNGNRVVIRELAEEAVAISELARFESLHHKQTYWIERSEAAV